MSSFQLREDPERWYRSGTETPEQAHARVERWHRSRWWSTPDGQRYNAAKDLIRLRDTARLILIDPQVIKAADKEFVKTKVEGNGT